MPSVNEIRGIVGAWLAPIMRYERHLSAIAMAGGFAFDNYAFGRVDRPMTHVVLVAYLLVAGTTIAITHRLQSRTDRKKQRREAELTRAARYAAAKPVRVEPIFAPAHDAAPSDPAMREAETDAASGSVRSASAATTVDALSGFIPQRIDGRAVRAKPPAPIARPKSKADDHAEKKGDPERTMLVAATQFALGGLSSAFLVFYSRSAAFASSWLFLLLLAAFLIGNEIFRKYHPRLVFSSLLLYFSLYSYSIFLVPVVTRTLGTFTFLASGAIAVVIFVYYLRLLRGLGLERFRQSRLAILGGVLAITAAMNLFYFTSILPPLPLALSNVGVFHTVKRTGATYTAVGENQTWYANVGLKPQILHVTAGEPVSLFSAVFAPVKLATRITHRWQWYDVARRRWVTQSTVSFAISGGRENGYRAYSIKRKPKPGDWRVDIVSEDGRLIGRERFTLVQVPKEAGLVTKILN